MGNKNAGYFLRPYLTANTRELTLINLVLFACISVH